MEQVDIGRVEAVAPTPMIETTPRARPLTAPERPMPEERALGPMPPMTAGPQPTPRATPRPGTNHVPTQPPSLTDDPALERTATAPQLRRFIKSRAYVPMHELRRRFAINGGDDDVTPVDIERRRVFVGLPEREGRLLGELLRAGDIGYELSLDPISPIVVGVYPMRPVTRS